MMAECSPTASPEIVGILMSTFAARSRQLNGKTLVGRLISRPDYAAFLLAAAICFPNASNSASDRLCNKT
jgi:hypothetical protein